MKYKLINEPNKEYSATIQVLINRGIKKEKIKSFLEANMDSSVNNPLAFGEDRLKIAGRTLVSHIKQEDDLLCVVDSDCDGMTSSALLINYLYAAFPAYAANHVHWIMHKEKKHGLSDCVDEAMKYKLVILPDASSSDYEQHEALAAQGTDIIVLDHHEAPRISEKACIINNQLCDYPNKALSGVGVTWQFCRYLDMASSKNYAADLIDLVALGLVSDMMDMREEETKALIFEGFKDANIHNPFIYEMSEKNSFSLNKADYKPSAYNGLKISPMGAAFFIAPFVNAMVRSGTMEEKLLVFNSMITTKAFEMIPSNKRGHKLGEMERLVDQAIRTCTNVKNRQTKAQNEGMELIEKMIAGGDMLQHKVLLFLLDEGAIDRNVAGLCANKIMAKYQRPVAILIKTVDKETGEISYSGSARGYGNEVNFREMCENAGVRYAQGHSAAFGLSLDPGCDGTEPQLALGAAAIKSFLETTDELLKDVSEEPVYHVDYVWDSSSIDRDKILEIADMNDYWGKNIERAYVLVKNIKVTEDSFKVMKSNTLKYSLPGVDIIQFGGTEEEIELFSSGVHTINAVCKCAANEWNGMVSPQLIMEDYEIVENDKIDILSDWVK